MPEVFGQESWFNENAKFYKDVYVYGTLYYDFDGLGDNLILDHLEAKSLKVSGISTFVGDVNFDIITGNKVGVTTVEATKIDSTTIDTDNIIVRDKLELTNDDGTNYLSAFASGTYAGRVGIGTEEPERLLDVVGDIRLRNHIYDSSDEKGAGSGYYLSQDATGIRWVFVPPDSLSEGFFIQNEGDNVGVGSFTTINFIGNTGGGDIIQAAVNAGNTKIVDVTVISHWLSNTSGLGTSGSVGIGSTQPTETLDVVGDARIVGTLTSNDIVVTGVTTTEHLLVTGITTLGFTTASDLLVTGITTLGVTTASSLLVTGITTLGVTTASSLQVTGISTFIDDVNIGTGGTTAFFDVSAGRVSIGTDNPTKTLDVVGYGTENGIRVGDTHFFAFGDGGSANKGSPTFQNLNTNGNTILRVLPNGTGRSQFEFFATDYFANAGIGTTTWNNLRIYADNNQGEIRIDTSAATEAGVAKSISIETNVEPGGGTRPNQYQLYLDVNGNIGLGTNAPLQKFQIGAANTLGISTDGKVFTVTSDGSVGIGTTIPTAKLDVNGTANVTGVATFTTSDTNHGSWPSVFGDGTAIRIKATNLSSYDNSGNGSVLSFDSVMGLYGKFPANVSIANTLGTAGINFSDGDIMRDVVQEDQQSGSFAIFGRNRTNSHADNYIWGSPNNGINIGYASSDISDGSVQTASGLRIWKTKLDGDGYPNQVLVINGYGDIGINTPAPTATLDVNGTLNVSGVSTFKDDVNIGTGGTTAFFDISSGNVGIGSTIPTATLDVDGDVAIGRSIFDSNGGVGKTDYRLASVGAGVSWRPPGVETTNILYVTKDGNDNNSGLLEGDAKATIGGAAAVAQDGDTIYVRPGTYFENNPIGLRTDVSISGQDLRLVTVVPNNPTEDLFHVRRGCLIENMNFAGNNVSVDHTGAAMVAFPPTGSATQNSGYVAAGPANEGPSGRYRSPYVRNCTNFATGSVGMRVDGNHVNAAYTGTNNLGQDLKSMVVDSYTQYNQNGIGVSLTNKAYAQLVSIFTINCDIAIYASSGGQCDLTNSNSSFGNYGLYADGTSGDEFTGITTVAADAESDTFTFADLRDSDSSVRKPFDGQGAFFRLNLDSYPDTGTKTGIVTEPLRTVRSISITNAGSGYTSTNPPVVTITSPLGPEAIDAELSANVSSAGTITSIDVIASGRNFLPAGSGSNQQDISVTIAAPTSGTTATADAVTDPILFTVASSTEPTTSTGIGTITFNEFVPYSVGVGTSVAFRRLSRIITSSHSFEYVGAGTDINRANPFQGGVPIPENEVVAINGGQVPFTSTDQKGNFKIGNGLTIDQTTSTISGRDFNRAIQANLTPLIIALGG